jgi:hypothetical protein
MYISVEGSRASISDWEAVRNLPREQLPGLTPEQKEVASKLGIPEEDYARSVLAGQRTMERLLTKTERLARLLEPSIRARQARAAIEHVTLNTWEDRFEIQIRVDGNPFPLMIEESVIDDLFESGSADAEERLRRILDIALQVRVP